MLNAKQSYNGGSFKSDLVARILIHNPSKFDVKRISKPSKYLMDKYKSPHHNIKNQIIKEIEPEKIQIKNSIQDDINYINIKSEIDFINKFLTTGRKENFKTEKQNNAFNNLLNAVSSYDYYPTPERYGKLLYEDVLKMYKDDIDEITVLDIGCGLLSLSMPFIENNLNTYLIEENKNWYNVIKPLEKFKHVKMINEDFFDLPQDYYYKKDIHVIIMNPPFACPINGERVVNAYLYFIIKAIDILINNKSRYELDLYVICPKTYFKNNNELQIPKTLLKKALKVLDIEDWTEYLIPYITYLGDVEGFKTIRKGKPVDMALKVGLYKFSI
jgi:predicted RNA methylase